MMADTFSNPIMTGFHPDPSVCRVPGGGYLLVASSFEYFPGVPIFSSDDLVTWTPLGHVLDRPEQLDLTDVEFSDGIWATTIREHNGLFYVVSTVVRGRRGADNFLVTTTDPAGAWSDPVWLGVEGIDPSLFFDDDGRCWFTACRNNSAEGNPGELWMQELDLHTLSLVGPQSVLWTGALIGAWIEGPHIYKNSGTYYLVAAEGGTEANHAVTVASSSTVDGPYRGLPSNPVLTHRHLGADYPVQNVGHADLVETDAGETWAVVLGVRPRGGGHVLGREVFLLPVSWEATGPVFSPGVGHVPEVARRPSHASLQRAGGGASTSTTKNMHRWDSPVWSTVRHSAALSGIEIRGEEVSLALLPGSLRGREPQAALVRRQQHHSFVAWVQMDFTPECDGEEAGLVVLQHRHAWAASSVRQVAGATCVVVELHSAVAPSLRWQVAVTAGPVELGVRASDASYEFLMRCPGSAETLLARVSSDHLTTEAAGGFTGVMIGPFATSNGVVSDSRAVFTDFRYEPADGGASA
jgi:xylan 1,4-beta-xylosidase